MNTRIFSLIEVSGYYQELENRRILFFGSLFLLFEHGSLELHGSMTTYFYIPKTSKMTKSAKNENEHKPLARRSQLHKSDELFFRWTQTV